MRFPFRPTFALLAGLCASLPLMGQNLVTPAWLRYTIPPDPPRYHDMPHAVVQLGDALEEQTAADELDRGLGHMVAGTDHLLRHFDPRLDTIVLGTSEALRRVRPRMLLDPSAPALAEDAYRIRHVVRRERQWWVLEGGSPRAELYAAFRFAALVAEDRQLPDSLTETARVPLRALSLHGDMATLAMGDGLTSLARLMASVALNGLVVDEGMLAPEQVIAAMRPYGIHVWFRGVSADTVAGLAGAGGIAMHASTDLKQLEADTAKADAAAHTLRRHNESVLLEDAFEPAWQPGNAPVDQRAAAFHGLESNVMLVSNAVPPSLPFAGLASPTFGLLPNAPQAASFLLFPGQGRALVYPAAIWESILMTPQRNGHDGAPLDDVLAHHGAVIASATVDEIATMLHQPLLQANLFAFGRVAWNASEMPDSITDAWARQTFGDDARVFGVAKDILLRSAAAFTNVSSPFGMPWLGEDARPDPRRFESGIHASREGIGIDRTALVTAGYPTAFTAELTDSARTPEKWLLAVHRVPPTHRMGDGKTVVQDFYDAHFTGTAQMSNALDAWEDTKPLVDPERYAAVHDQLSDDLRRGEVWRDTVTEWMQRSTGVADELNFVGNHPGRTEAETMALRNYVVSFGLQPEDASAGSYAACPSNEAECQATTVYRGEANAYRVEVGYYDALRTGQSLELRVNGAPQARWPVEVITADHGQQLTAEQSRPGSATAERYVVDGVRLKPGDRLTVAGQAAIDFIDISRDPRWN